MQTKRLLAVCMASVMVLQTPYGTFDMSNVMAATQQNEVQLGVFEDSNGVTWNAKYATDGKLEVSISSIDDALFNGKLSVPSEVTIKGKTYLVQRVSKVGNVSISGVKYLEVNDIEIGDSAFQNFSYLTSVELNNVNTIGTSAFAACTSLVDVSIKSDNEVTIGNMAFSGSAVNLNKFKVDAPVTRINDNGIYLQSVNEGLVLDFTGNLVLNSNFAISVNSFDTSKIKLKIGGSLRPAEVDKNNNKDNSGEVKSHTPYTFRDSEVLDETVFSNVNSSSSYIYGSIDDITIGYNDKYNKTMSFFTNNMINCGRGLMKSIKISTPLEFFGSVGCIRGSIERLVVDGEYITVDDYSAPPSKPLVENVIGSAYIDTKEADLCVGLANSVDNITLGFNCNSYDGMIIGSSGIKNGYGISKILVLNPTIIEKEKLNIGNSTVVTDSAGNKQTKEMNVSYMSCLMYGKQGRELLTSKFKDLVNNLKSSKEGAIKSIEGVVDNNKAEVGLTVKEADCVKANVTFSTGETMLLDVNDEKSAKINEVRVSSSDYTKKLTGVKSDDKVTIEYSGMSKVVSIDAKETNVDHLILSAPKTKYYDGEEIPLADFTVSSVNKDGTTTELNSFKVEYNGEAVTKLIASYADSKDGILELKFIDPTSGKYVVCNDITVGRLVDLEAEFIGKPLEYGGKLDVSNVKATAVYSNNATKIVDVTSTSTLVGLTLEDLEDVEKLGDNYVVYRNASVNYDNQLSTNVKVPFLVTGSLLDTYLGKVQTPVPTDVIVKNSPSPSVVPTTNTTGSAVTSPSASGVPDVTTGSVVTGTPVATQSPNAVTVQADNTIKTNDGIGFVKVILPTGMNVLDASGMSEYSTYIKKGTTAQLQMSNISKVEAQVVSKGAIIADDKWKSCYSVNLAQEDGFFELYLRITSVMGDVGVVKTSGYVVDSTAPVVEGVEDGGKYKESAGFTVSDMTDFSYIVLANDTTKEVMYVEEKGVVGQGQMQATKADGSRTIGALKVGKYTLKATDNAGNKLDITFYVDNEAPKCITGIKNKGVYKAKKVYVTFTDSVEMNSVKVNGTEVGTSCIITKQGKYTIVATDTVGNTTKMIITIDRKAPTIKGVKNGKTYKGKAKIKVSDKYGIKYIKLNGKTIKNKSTIKKKGKYTLVVTDKAGNKKTVKFRIKK